MKSETKTCANCKNSFVIEPEDFTFYDKIHVPPPTWCPECRRQRRLSWRNDMSLHTRVCDLCKKRIISIYSESNPFPVYCQKCWWSDTWDPKDYAQEYDFSKDFFTQYKELQNKVPVLAMVNDDGIGSVSCEYTQDFSFAKNCYMCFIGWKVEDCMYGEYCVGGKNLVDFISSMGGSEFVYDAVFTDTCYRCRNSYYSDGLTGCAYVYDCRNCSDCLMCTGLRHKKYCFNNQQYTKEEYERIVSDYKLHTYSGSERAKKEFAKLLVKYPRKFAYFRNTVNCTGDCLYNGKNSRNCFNVQRPEDSKWVTSSDTPKDCYDLSTGGELNLCYEGITPDHSSKSAFSIFSWKNADVAYVDGCHSSKKLFGCCGMKKAQYCILNKQYTPEEYEKIIAHIKAQMGSMPYTDKVGRKYGFGEFFPPELSYFGYNETCANEEFPLSKEEVGEKGYIWSDDVQMTVGKETLRAENILDSIRDVSGDILKEVLACVECGRNYRIIERELQFYRSMEIPVPRKCFFCRHRARSLIKNSFKLWHRTCMCGHANHGHGGQCPNEFETSYAPDRPEIVYCESCYQREVA